MINAGSPSAYSSSNAALIKKSLINYEPDLFIIYSGWNDLGKSSDGKDFDKDESVQTVDVLRLLLKNDYYKSFGI